MPTKFPNTIQLEASARKGNKVVAMSGRRTRNMDWFSGKYFRFIPEGVRLEDYRANNILLWRHSTYDPQDILGTAEVDIENGQLVADPDINAPSERARLVKKLWDMGTLKAVSVRVGFSPEDLERVIESENEIIFPSAELQEVSIVPLPADPGAVRQAAFSLGLTPERAEQLLMEVNMEDETLDAVEEQEEGGVEPFVLELTAEDYANIAEGLVANETAAHVLRDALVSTLVDEVAELRNEVARLAGEPTRRTPVSNSIRLGWNSRQQEAAPPANIRQPQRNGKGATPKTTAASFHLRKQNNR